MDWEAELRRRLIASRALLIQNVATVPETGWTVKPRDGGWTALETLEHISRVDRSVARLVDRLADQGEADQTYRVLETADRRWEARILYKAGSKPFAAPAPTHPKGEASLSDLMAALEKSRNQLEATLPRLRLLDTDRLTFPHTLGFDLNALQWVHLASWHETRHVMQIQRTQFST